MNENSENPIKTEQLQTVQSAENKEYIQPEANPNVKKSMWQKIKDKKTNIAGGITLAFYIASGSVAEAKNHEYIPQPADNKPVAEQIAPQVDFKTKMQKMEHLYSAGFSDRSLDSSYDMYKLLQDIRNSPEFNKLDPSAKAEILHREGYSLLSANKAWFAQNYKNFPQEHTKDFLENYSRTYKLFKESVVNAGVNAGEVSQEHERTINALIETSKTMAEQAVKLKVERPDLHAVGEQLQENLKDPLELAFSLDPRMHYIGKGLFVFSEQEQEKAISGIIGLIKATRALPPNIPTEQLLGAIEGAMFDIKEQVAPWANGVKKGKFPTTPSELAFIDNMVKLGILKFEAGKYTASDGEDLVLAPSDPVIFSHEIAHQVEKENPKYLQKAESDYQQLSESDRKDFDAFMKIRDPKLNKKIKMKEFFAYYNQLHGLKYIKEQLR